MVVEPFDAPLRAVAPKDAVQTTAAALGRVWSSAGLEQLVDEGADVTVGNTFNCSRTGCKMERKLMKPRYPFSLVRYPQRRQHAAVLGKRSCRVATQMWVETCRDYPYLLS